jgi:hypothetical protein
MNYARKVNTLTKIYRWHFRFVDGSRKTRVLITRLEKLEATLKEAGETRNRYAHANWETLTKDRFVKTRTRAATDGAKHTFRQFDRSVMKRDLGLVRKAYRLLETFDEMFHCQMPF